MSSKRVRARWWKHVGGQAVCLLCPRECRINAGATGFCRMRRFAGDELITLTYGHPQGLAVDPIEKKPLYHFLPASDVLSFGTTGCTLACKFCQNWTLSQSMKSDEMGMIVEPAQIVELAKQKSAPMIAYTYNEPAIFGEYLIDVARLAHEAGIRNVMVSNGFIAPGAREEIMADIDAVNIDLKGFSERFYQTHTRGSLAPVLDTLVWVNKAPHIWLEITTLLIPGLNDSDEMLAAEFDWIVDQLGLDVPLHLTAFHPDYQMRDRSRTSSNILTNAREIAISKGLRYVYTGNVVNPEGQGTICPSCGFTVMTRTWQRTGLEGLVGNTCASCGAVIAGVYK